MTACTCLRPRRGQLYSPGNEPIKTANRNKFVDVYNADSVELRFRYLCYFGCSAPGFNAVVQLS